MVLVKREIGAAFEAFGSIDRRIYKIHNFLCTKMSYNAKQLRQAFPRVLFLKYQSTVETFRKYQALRSAF